MGGTMILSRHQKGCYIDLLIAQFNNGPLSLETIKTLLGQDQASWTVLSSKFKQDSEGNFSNERLATEIEKRKNFVNKQSQNGSKGGRPPTNKPKNNPRVSFGLSNIENENRNKDLNENEIRDRGVGKGEDFLWTSVVKNFFNDYNWKEKFCRDKYLEMKFLETKMQEFISDLELKEDFKELKELKNHFTNWFNKNKNGISTSKTKQHSQAAAIANAIKIGQSEFAAAGKKDY